MARSTPRRRPGRQPVQVTARPTMAGRGPPGASGPRRHVRRPCRTAAVEEDLQPAAGRPRRSRASTSRRARRGPSSCRPAVVRDDHGRGAVLGPPSRASLGAQGRPSPPWGPFQQAAPPSPGRSTSGQGRTAPWHERRERERTQAGPAPAAGATFANGHARPAAPWWSRPGRRAAQRVPARWRSVIRGRDGGPVPQVALRPPAEDGACPRSPRALAVAGRRRPRSSQVSAPTPRSRET